MEHESDAGLLGRIKTFLCIQHNVSHRPSLPSAFGSASSHLIPREPGVGRGTWRRCACAACAPARQPAIRRVGQPVIFRSPADRVPNACSPACREDADACRLLNRTHNGDIGTRAVPPTKDADRHSGPFLVHVSELSKSRRHRPDDRGDTPTQNVRWINGNSQAPPLDAG